MVIYRKPPDMKYLLYFAMVSSISLSSVAQSSPEAAQDILRSAYKQAAKENKKVFVIFHASWCGWCHKMDTAMNDESCRKLFNDNYVIRHLDVMETNEKKALENPGAMDIMKEYGGDNGGIPFWLVFDEDGKLLADSHMKAGVNTGCPASKEEIDYFLQVLQKTSSLNDRQLIAIKKRFSKINGLTGN
ncbi:MAG: hypothetical protein JWN76_1012 [Chitinophagaceae bacterium]|nr:hypothetical protein [Chitinophagaceae bacterium]